MHSPSAPPFSFLCVCQHEPKILFSGSEESWKWGLKTRLCGPPSAGATCCFAPECGEMGAGSWLLSGHRAAIVSWKLQEPSWFAAAKAADAATTWLPNPCFLWGLEPWTAWGWPHGHRFLEAHRQFSLCLAAASLLIYGLVFSDKSQTCNFQFCPRLSG